MEKQHFSFADTGRFSRLFLDYVANKPELSELYAHRPEQSAFAEAVAAKSAHPINRGTLVTALQGQYAGYELPAAVQTNIDALASDTTFTVTTGHQLCLFTGPLYFLYKIATAINLATQLNASENGKQFVPVYWMASEDHDFDEINHANLFGQTLRWEHDAKGPVGWLETEAMAPVLDALEAVLGTRSNATELLTMMRAAYQQQPTLAAATRFLVHELFGSYGLVIVDGDDAALKACFAPAMRTELLEQPSAGAVRKNTAVLESCGHKGQVTPRAINLFWIEPGVRSRIVPDGDDFEVLNHRKMTRSELLSALEEHPEKFSPNVVLRPLYQEMVLPNVAYIGGPGELAYWLQLKGVFDAYEVPFPVLMPRNFLMLLDGGIQKKLTKLELLPADLFTNLEQLKKSYVATHASGSLSLAAEKEQLSTMYAALRDRAVAIDPSLKGAVEGEEQRQLKALDGLEKRLVKAEKQRHETALSQLDGMANKLFPNNSLQERHDNFIPYYLRYGQSFIDELLATLDPFRLEMVLLKER